MTEKSRVEGDFSICVCLSLVVVVTSLAGRKSVWGGDWGGRERKKVLLYRARKSNFQREIKMRRGRARGLPTTRDSMSNEPNNI